ncbi:MAG: feruloyl-CoA synthase [Rhodocyclaceae bacterium]|nr:MAG: feruloyl-CoA synthase [Rhodocyclaceae bacterium]
MTKPPFNSLNFAPALLDIQPLHDGGMVLRSPQKLGPYSRCVGEYLLHWGTTTPDSLFLAERDSSGDWRKVTYGEALGSVRRLAQALLDRRLSVERPLVILSDNSIDHALMALGAMHAGIPVAPVSSAYSLVSKDYVKLKHILALLQPGAIFVQDGIKFAPALKAAGPPNVEVITTSNPPSDLPMTLFAQVHATPAGADVDRAFASVSPDTIAKILFTSGSTDLPKGVINTQRMLCSNQQTIAQVWHFLSEKPPVIVDWLPWNHTFGGNHNFNMMLRHGGSIYIDEGKPAPGLIERTVANLREISPTLYFNVPRGYDMLLHYLERDEELSANYLRKLDLIFYAAAALPQNLWERLENLAIKVRGKRVRMVSSWGSTETAPMVTAVHFDIDRAGVIGLPTPGVELKMVPNAGKMELRIRGPNVTPGYFKRDDLTRAAFDAEGFYCIGDAGRFADPHDPTKGIEFDGRIAEDFKLSSGTWVHVGALRILAIAAGAPIIQDCVVTGHDREEVGLLVFPNPVGCRSLCPDAPADLPLSALIVLPQVQQRLGQALSQLASSGSGSSTYPTRALLMADLPAIDDNEITDKGYINQRAVLMRRANLVERLYATEPDAEVMLL